MEGGQREWHHRAHIPLKIETNNDRLRDDAHSVTRARFVVVAGPAPTLARLRWGAAAVLGFGFALTAYQHTLRIHTGTTSSMPLLTTERICIVII